MDAAFDPRRTVVELCKQFYALGWASGTGGGISLRHEERFYVAPSGVQKERLSPQDLFVLDHRGEIVERPADARFTPSACTPLFFNAFRLREAGAVLHSHSMHAMLATLLCGDVFRVTHLEMMKGLSGVGYHDLLEIPVIENTAHECDLADAMADAMRRYPDSHAVLVRRHGVYIWGRDWVQAKTHAECLDYLFEASVRMHALGLSASKPPVAQGGNHDHASTLAR